MISAASRRLWRTHLPFHAFFLILALIGYFKADTFVGVWVLAASLALTAGINALARKYRGSAKVSDGNDSESAPS